MVVGEGDERRERKYSNGEINRELTTLKRILNLARQNGKLMHVPHVPMLKERNVRTGFFEREQIERILARLPLAIRPAVQFAYITGWRIPSEVLKLQWRHVDFEARVVRLDPHTTKNDEGRTFPFTDGLAQLLAAQKAEHERLKADGVICPWVFNRSNRKVKGKRITTFIKAFRAACTKAGCPGRIPHDLRRTAVRNLVRAGVPERVAMQMTGHKTRSVFERYNIVSECDLVEAAKKLNTLQPLPPSEVRLKPDSTSEDRDQPSVLVARDEVLQLGRLKDRHAFELGRRCPRSGVGADAPVTRRMDGRYNWDSPKGHATNACRHRAAIRQPHITQPRRAILSQRTRLRHSGGLGKVLRERARHAAV